MTEIKVETAPEPAKALLALNPTQEAEFKKKVQEVKKNKSKKVGKEMNRVHLQTKGFYLIFPSKVVTTIMLSSH